MLLGIDHLVIAVPDLATAQRQYEALGFTVVPGGRHPVGTHNALVAFADGLAGLLPFKHTVVISRSRIISSFFIWKIYTQRASEPHPIQIAVENIQALLRIVKTFFINDFSKNRYKVSIAGML